MNKRTVMVIGAHPDDCEIQTGGFALKCVQMGYRVIFMSATNGETGHHELSREDTARIRKGEFEKSCSLGGIECIVTDIPSNKITPDIMTREMFVSIIRRCKPDIIITHRLNDYHPDHRITAQLVQDSSYAIKVPKVCPDVEPLRYSPVILYMSDQFKRPYEFAPHIALDIDDVLEKKMQMLACHESQVFEWLPWVDGELDQVPADKEQRYEWMKKNRSERDKKNADRFRSLLCKRYGEEKGRQIVYAEAFEICEYGKQISVEDLEKIFPV